MKNISSCVYGSLKTIDRCRQDDKSHRILGNDEAGF